MKDNRKSEIKVGLTVILALIVMVLIFSWTKNFSAYSNRIQLKIKFDSVAGVEKGDPVTINGLKKGFVDDIILSKTDVIVIAMMDKNIELYDNATFSVLMYDLMGGKKIEIFPGNSDTPLDINKTHSGTFAGDIATAMAMFSSVQGDLIAVIKDLRISLSNINELMADANFSENVKSSLTNLNKLAVSLNNLVDENKTRIKNLLDNGIELTSKGSEFIDKNSDKVTKFLETSNSTLENVNKLSEQVNKFLTETSNQENNLGTILYDKQIIDDLKISLKELKDLVKMFNEQLKGKGLKVDAYIF